MAAALPILIAAALAGLPPDPKAAARVDLSGWSPASGVLVEEGVGRLRVRWPLSPKGTPAGEVVFRLTPEEPLIERLDVEGAGEAVLRDSDPFFRVTVGSRKGTPGRPPAMSAFNEFFDSPAGRPHETRSVELKLSSVKVASAGRRATVTVGDLAAGGFSGVLCFSFYAGSPLIHLEAVLTTAEDARAYVYEAGLGGRAPLFSSVHYFDTEGRLRRAADSPPQGALAVRHRTIAGESAGGSLAAFPPPHQFFFPRDLTDNLSSAFYGSFDGAVGMGVRQAPSGGGSFVPWFNAPPGTKQRLGVFYLLSRGNAEEALKEALRYTHGDRFPPLPGHITLTSHWHMAIAMAAIAERAKGRPPPADPDFVRMFREMGVNAVHLAEFHGDGHQKDPGPERLPEMDSMFSECRRLSGPDLLFIPGEEGNDYLGVKEPGKHPGHWMCIFPRPVHWTQVRQEGQPFLEEDPARGRVYHVGSRADMVDLLRLENGLAWSAHPRIKASSWTPDIFRKEEFYLSDHWLGGAWKAMPADLSRERLGERALDLLDDMCNWGQRKYLPGEVDVFKIDHTHELYGHMNINYLRLDRLPRYEEGWQPVLDALRAGRFFVTTGEVLIRKFTLGGKESGETLAIAPGDSPELSVELEWTFPLRFVEAISGDGKEVHRERLDLPDAVSFERRALTLRPRLEGRRWLRLEAWDVAANGAYTQPVWLEERSAAAPR